jgi:hypothetical protein
VEVFLKRRKFGGKEQITNALEDEDSLVQDAARDVLGETQGN